MLMTDPPLLPLITKRLQRQHTRVVHWVQDLYPDVAVSLGAVPAPLAVPLEVALQRARQRADAVVAIGTDMAHRLGRQGVRDPMVVPNWAPPVVRPEPRRPNALRTHWGLENEYIVMYSGRLGRAHDEEHVYDLGCEVDEIDGARFVLVGGGPGTARTAERRGIMWVPAMDRSKLSESLAAADLHVVTQDVRTRGLLVPSKTYGVLVSGRPVAFLGPESSDAADAIRGSHWGRVVDPGDIRGVLSWIRSLMADPPELPVKVPSLPSVSDAADAFEALLRRLARLDHLTGEERSIGPA